MTTPVQESPELATGYTKADAAKFLYRLICEEEASARSRAASSRADYTARSAGRQELEKRFQDDDYNVGGFCPIPDSYNDSEIKRAGEKCIKDALALDLWVKTRDFVVEHFIATFVSAKGGEPV